LIPHRKDDIIYKRGYVLSAWQEKGMGSAFGGRWRPTTTRNMRFKGKPGEIKTTFIKQTTESYWVETLIGKDGYAIIERHWSIHKNGDVHSLPHDHIITWENNHPNFQKQINYFGVKPPNLSDYE